MKPVPVIPDDQRKGGALYPGDKVVIAHLFHDIKEANFDHLAMLLGGYPEARGYLSESGHTPLQLAITHGKDESLRWLLQNGGMDIDQSTKVFGTALHCAIYRRKPETVALLLEHGADMQALDVQGHTAVSAAVQIGAQDISDLLQAESLKRLKDTISRDFNTGTTATIALKKPLSVTGRRGTGNGQPRPAL